MPDIFDKMEMLFTAYIRENINSTKAEFFIPYVGDKLINSGEGNFYVLGTPESWFGVTYQADRPMVLAMVNELVEKGTYPSPLWK